MMVRTSDPLRKRPWVTGPRELLQHGFEHLRSDTDFDRRIAFISIDNAVELALKTFFSLPKRVTGIAITRKQFEPMSMNFPQLLKALEEYASDRLVGIELADLEWYHRLRNRIYYAGCGLTVERENVEGYAEVARILYENLFDDPFESIAKIGRRTTSAEFIHKWAVLENALWSVAEKAGFASAKKSWRLMETINWLHKQNLISNRFLESFKSVRESRTKIIQKPDVNQIQNNITKLDKLLAEMNILLNKISCKT
ncbi:MAG: hypothetical protein DRH12_06525 [Deltaproteobacteria bacterium]|nr:MAG: hypothetical protein DRH12_06525 [Deltaproteobacteria bacterium]